MRAVTLIAFAGALLLAGAAGATGYREAGTLALLGEPLGPTRSRMEPVRLNAGPLYCNGFTWVSAGDLVHWYEIRFYWIGQKSRPCPQ